MSLEHNDKIEWVALEKLKPHPKNRNKHPEEQIERLAEILKYQGFRQPIVVSNLSGHIVAGHGRLQAAYKMGLTKVPVSYQDFTDTDQELAHLTADNAIASWAELDFAGINLDVTDLGPDFNIDMLGIKDFEIEPADKYADQDADAVPDKVPARAKLGDIYQLGAHRLMCGDSTDLATVEKLMAGEKAEFCFTSPPYSDQREYNGAKDLAPEHLAKFLMAPAKCFAVNLGLKRSGGKVDTYWDAYINCAEENGLKLTSWNIWNRQGFGFSIGNATATFPIEHEFIFVFGEPDVTNAVVENKSSGREDDYQTIRMRDVSTKKRSGTKIKSHRPLGTVLHLGKEAERTIDHPAKFPVSLPETYIRALTGESANIYEPFGGSGSTLIACEKTNRKCFMMELDPHYVDVIIARWEKFTGQKAEKLGDTEKPNVKTKRAK